MSYADPEMVGGVGAARTRRVHRLRGNWTVGVCAALLLIVMLVAITGDLFAPYAPGLEHLDVGTVTPSSHWLLGTDSLGRDVLSRTIAGTRSAIIGPLIIAFGTAAISVGFGVWAGYSGGVVDGVIMRIVDFMYATPPLLVVIVVVGLLGGGYFLSVGILMLISAPYDVRVIRAVALEQRALPYVDAVRTLGLSRRQIMFRHIAPNVVPFVIVNSSLEFAFGLVTLSSLSFLGFGAPPGAPDWGRMIEENSGLLFQNPASVLGPGIALAVTAVAVNLLGEGLASRWTGATMVHGGR